MKIPSLTDLLLGDCGYRANDVKGKHMQGKLIFFAIVFGLAIIWWLARLKPSRKTVPIKFSHLFQLKTHTLLASEMLKKVRALQKMNAQWPQIKETLGVTENLKSIQGPHLFAPHTALNVIEHGCMVAIGKNPQADFNAALYESKLSMEKITNFGD